MYKLKKTSYFKREIKDRKKRRHNTRDFHMLDTYALNMPRFYLWGVPRIYIVMTLTNRMIYDYFTAVLLFTMIFW